MDITCATDVASQKCGEISVVAHQSGEISVIAHNPRRQSKLIRTRDGVGVADVQSEKGCAAFCTFELS